MTRSIKLTVSVLVAVLPLVQSGCNARGKSTPSAARLIVFVDLSASVDREQRRLWEQQASRLADAISPGWSVSVHPIHDQTLGAAPLFTAEVPEWTDEASYEVAQNQKRALIQARAGARAAIQKTLETGGGATRTDVFSAIDRIRPDLKHRRTNVVFFSDMLNSTPDLDLESAGTISRASNERQIRALAARHGWNGNLLAGSALYCVLNSIESGRRGPKVDRLTQREFYNALFGALGGRLALYDTTLDAQDLISLKGEGYVAAKQ